MTQRIKHARRGDRLSAGYVNQIVDGANLALKTLDGPSSKRTPETSSGDVATDAQGTGDLEGVGTEVFTEESRETSTVRIYDPTDEDVYVDVERIDQISLTSADRRITLVFDNS